MDNQISLFKDCLISYIHNTYKNKGYKHIALCYTYNLLQYLWDNAREFYQLRKVEPLFDKNLFNSQAAKLLRDSSLRTLEEQLYVAVAEVCAINDPSMELERNQRVDRLVNAFGFANSTEMNAFLKEKQKNLWEAIETFFYERYQLILLMPESGKRTDSGPWCYIRYPFFQCLLDYSYTYQKFEEFKALHSQFLKKPEVFHRKCHPDLEKFTLKTKSLQLRNKGIQQCVQETLYAEYRFWNEKQLAEKLRHITQKQNLTKYTIKPSKNPSGLWQLRWNLKNICYIPSDFNDEMIFTYDPNYEDWYCVSTIAVGDPVAILFHVEGKNIPKDARVAKHGINGIKGWQLYVLDTPWENDGSIRILNAIHNYIRLKISSFTFLGGLTCRKSRRCWFDFALPSIKLNENQKEIIIDDKKVPVQNGLINLASLNFRLEDGEHSFSLPGFFGKIKFTIIHGAKEQYEIPPGGWFISPPSSWHLTTEENIEGVLQGLIFQEPPETKVQESHEDAITKWYQYVFKTTNPSFAAYIRKMRNDI